MCRTLATIATLVCVLAFTPHQRVPHAGGPPPVGSVNPFAELDREAAGVDRKSTRDLWKLVRTAYRLELHGSARRLAREVLKLDPQHRLARPYLGDRPLQENGGTTWLDPFQWEMRQRFGLRRERCRLKRISKPESGAGLFIRMRPYNQGAFVASSVS